MLLRGLGYICSCNSGGKYLPKYFRIELNRLSSLPPATLYSEVDVELTKRNEQLGLQNTAYIQSGTFGDKERLLP